MDSGDAGSDPKNAENKRQWKVPALLSALFHRPYLVTAVLFGLGIYFATGPWVPRGITRVLIGWDCGVVVFLCSIYLVLRHADPEEIKSRAAEYNEGGRLVLVITILASIASVGALVAELSGAKGQGAGGLRVALAAFTVVLSWLLVHIAFALRYAHIYYLAQRSGPSRGGLMFGEEGEPDYWDFVHFSLVIGATSQTADVALTHGRCGGWARSILWWRSASTRRSWPP